MYRTQYPDAPNLFSNVRRPYRPTLIAEFSKTWLISTIGLILVLFGIFTYIFNEVCNCTYTFIFPHSSKIIHRFF